MMSPMFDMLLGGCRAMSRFSRGRVCLANVNGVAYFGSDHMGYGGFGRGMGKPFRWEARRRMDAIADVLPLIGPEGFPMLMPVPQTVANMRHLRSARLKTQERLRGH